MPTETFYNPNSKKLETRKTVTEEQTEKAKSAETFGTTKGKNLGAAGKDVDSGAPRQEQGETPAAFAKRFREYRESRAKK